MLEAAASPSDPDAFPMLMVVPLKLGAQLDLSSLTLLSATYCHSNGTVMDIITILNINIHLTEITNSIFL